MTNFLVKNGVPFLKATLTVVTRSLGVMLSCKLKCRRKSFRLCYSMILGCLSEGRGCQSDLLPSAHNTNTSTTLPRTQAQLPRAYGLQEALLDKMCTGSSRLLIWIQAWEEGGALPVCKPRGRGWTGGSPAVRVCRGQEPPGSTQVTQVPRDVRPKESGTSQGRGMISQSSSSLMGSNTPRLRVQAGAQGVDGRGRRDYSTLPQGPLHRSLPVHQLLP